MTPSIYNALARILVGGSLIALLAAIVYLAATVVGWRGPRRKPRLVRFAIFLGAWAALVASQQGLLWGVFLPSLAREQQRQVQERIDAASFVRVGDSAPSFALPDTEGREFDLAGERGKVVMVNFFATWCGPCLLELPHVQQLWEANRDRSDFALIAIGREETKESVTAFRSEHEFSFPMAADPQRAVYSLYAKELIPRMYLVSPDGTICFASTGFDEKDFRRLEQELAKQLDQAADRGKRKAPE